MLISGLEKLTLTDYPEKMAAIIFTQGCNLNCFYCHNRILINHLSSINKINPDAVLDFLKKRAGILNGVVVTGGEPTIQEDLDRFLLEIKKLGYEIKLDTNGMKPEVVADLLAKKLIDYVAIDVKAPESRYKDICGGDFKKVAQTINILCEAGIGWEARTTLAPTLSLSDIEEIDKWLPSCRWRLNDYRIPEFYLGCDEERIKGTPLKKAEITGLSHEFV